MTVLVLDSPELIARAAAFEAAQASQEVKAEETREVHADAEVSAPAGRPAQPKSTHIPSNRRNPWPLLCNSSSGLLRGHHQGGPDTTARFYRAPVTHPADPVTSGLNLNHIPDQ